MKMNRLGRTDVMVSQLCLGSMTWGTQNTLAEAHAQIDQALDAGVNFIDTAEMYPVNPVRAETTGRSEQIIGAWIAANRGRRDALVLASKHSGKGMKNARDGAPISAQTIPQAIEGSLRRLGTDYIDLYQFHWPNRGSYMFRQNWTYDPSHQDPAEVRANMQECLEVLRQQVEKGNIRHFGLSNESAWGMAQWLRLADEGAGPRAVTVQNEYSLLCRLYDTDLAELGLNEDVGLLAFSPLAAGYLSGKYADGAVPGGSRMALSPAMGGRKTARVDAAVAGYLEIARRFEMDPVHLALGFCLSRPFICAAIFGATRPAQLSRALGAQDTVLSEDVLAQIDAVHRAHPMPF